MSDQQSSGVAAAPAAGAAAVQPLAPPPSTASVLTLEAPAPVQAVSETAAPKMAPQVPAAAIPGLDAKVDGYLQALLTAQAKSPTFDAKATDVRTMGDDDIRRAAESSNRLLRTPVKALKEGGLSARAGKVGKTLLDLRRTVEDLDPGAGQGRQEGARDDPLRRQGHRLLPQVPVGPEPPRRHPARAARRPGRAAARQRRPQHGEAEPLGLHGPAQPVRLHRRAARRPPHRADRHAGGHRPREGDRPQAGRPVLRAPEAPGPADPAGGVDPELPGHRHHHQEQHRAHQGCRPGHDDDDLGPAHRRHRRAGPRQPEAGPRPDHGAQHDDEQPHPGHVGDAARQLGRRSRSRRPRRRSGCPSCRRRSRTSTRPWTRSTRTRSRRSTRWPQTIGTLETEVAKSQAYLERVNRQNPKVMSGSLDLGR